jgi:hypothetical protein
MKQKINILGLVSVLILVTGTVLKINHFPGAGIMLIIGITSLETIFLPLALINHYRAEGNRQTLLLYLVTGLTAFVVFTGMLFKIQHWPYAGYLLMISMPFPYVVFLPVYLRVTSKIQNFNIFNTVYVLIVLAGLSGFSALLALTVTQERIQESLSLSMHYNKFNNVISSLSPVTASHSQTIKYQEVIRKADDALKIVDEVQLLLLSKAGITMDQWQRDAVNDTKLDNRNAADEIYKGQDPSGYRLETGIRNFLAELEKTPGCKDLAILGPALMGFSKPGDHTSQGPEWLFAGTYRSWLLIDLDMIRLNLDLLKREITSI